MHKKILFAFAVLFIVALSVPGAVDARHRYQGYIKAPTTQTTNPWKQNPIEVSPSTSTTTPAVATTTATSNMASSTPLVVISAPTQAEVTFAAYVTGYSYWDNTPPGTAEISNPVLHKKAGGTGTYGDPITLAVGHSILGGKDILDYPEGTKFYLPYLQKYVIVEDTCGDGNTPQNGPCHSGYQGKPWIDLYVDGATISKSISDKCMNSITGVHPVIKNPGPNYPVTQGALSITGCKIY